MKKVVVTAAVAMLAACGPAETHVRADQCLRTQLFQQCLDRIPEGPSSTHYNDWNEVVDACEDSAYYQSLRKRKFIKPECES